mgnify:CR=1 FL=1
MAGVEKIIEKMKRQPNGIRPEEAEKVLNAYGYEYKRQKCSHRHYLHHRGFDNRKDGSAVESGLCQRHPEPNRGVNQPIPIS